MNSTKASGFRLTYQSETEPIARTFDQPRVLVGRSMICDVVIESADISRKHAEIVRDREGWTIQDLGSRTGTSVNDQRVTNRRLCDRDRIILAPNSATPVVITFRLPDKQSRVSQRVLLTDQPGRTCVLASIDLEEFERTLCGVPARSAVAGRPPWSAGARGAAGPAESLISARLRGSAAQLPVISLFRQVGEILLVSESLDEMLQKVIDLTMDSLPGQRGVVWIFDEKTGNIEPRVFRAKAGVGDRPFVVSRSILHEAIRVKQAMVVTNAVEDPRFHEAVSVQQMGIRAAMCVPLFHANQIKGVIYVDSQQAADEFDARDLEVLTVLGLMVAGGISQMTLRADVARKRAMLARLSRYNSPQVVEKILSQADEFEGEMLADEHEVSVLFADLTGFTSLADGMPPSAVVQLLNTVFEHLTSAVFANEGTLDKYIGDAVMAVFGAPLHQTDHAIRAVKTAMLMRQLLEDYCRRRGEGPPLKMRIGINSGKVIAGDIGSSLRKEYTVVGDVVNVASRLEASVAQPDEIVIGPATYELVKDLVECEPLPEVQLRGKRQGLCPYRVLRPK